MSLELGFLLYSYLQSQIKTMFSINLLLGLVGRLIYTISFLIQYYYVFGIRRKSLKNKFSPLLENKTSGASFWTKFTLKEILFVLISLPLDFFGVFILAYSVLLAGKNLRSCSSPSKDGISRNKILKSLGFFFNPVIYILGLLGLLFESINSPGYISNILNLLSVIIAGFIFKKMNPKKKSKFSLYEYLQSISFKKWNYISKPVKISLICSILIIPTTLYGYVYESFAPRIEEHWVEMNDGVKLRTRVYFPDGYETNSDQSTFPVLLFRTPYNIEAMETIAIFYTKTKNYIVVTQDLRGTPPLNPEGRKSEGNFNFFLEDSSDGISCIEWILDQQWSNGKIASAGGSALALNQMAYHPEVPQGVRAAQLLVGAGELFDYVYMIGGALRLHLVENWLPAVRGEDWDTIVDQMMENPIKTNFYENVSLEMNNRYENIDVRAVHIGGWYDMFCQGTIDGFMKYNMGTPYAQNHQILIMGPWHHGLTNFHKDITYPFKGQIKGRQMMENYIDMVFEEYLNDVSLNWDDIDKVNYFVMGDPDGVNSTITYNHWRTADIWPISHTKEAWYFHPNGSLSTDQPSEGQFLSYLYDPKNPVINGGGTTLTTEYIGAVDQRRVEYTTTPYSGNNKDVYDENWQGIHRDDILKFTSPVLEEPIEIIGQLFSELYIKTNVTDTDFTVKLMDVFPDGREMWIAEGILKTRYHEGYESLKILEEGNLYNITIDMWSTAYQFVPGNRIRISVSSSNYPKFPVNPNTGAPQTRTHPNNLVELGADYYIANNSISCGIEGQLSKVWFPRTNI